MSKSICKACNMQKNGVKSRLAFEHTCGSDQSLRHDVIEEKVYRHQWEEVEKGSCKYENRYVCKLCSCKKTVMGAYTSYARNGIHFGTENPGCWGAKNPQ